MVAKQCFRIQVMNQHPCEPWPCALLGSFQLKKQISFFLTNEDISSPCYLCRDTKIKSLDLRHLLHCWTYQHMGHLFAENRAVFAAGLVCIPTCVLQHFSCTQKRGILWILWFLGGSMVCLTFLEMYQGQFSCVWGQDDWLKHSEIFSLPSWVIECPRCSMIFNDPSLSVSEQFRPTNAGSWQESTCLYV